VWDGQGATKNEIRFNAISGNTSVGHQVVTAYTSPTAVDHPAIASSGGTDDMVVYEVGTGGATDLVATRITGLTTKSNALLVSEAGGSQSQPSVAWNGVYLVVWQDRRDDPNVADIYTGRLNKDGTRRNGDGVFLFDEDGASDTTPTIARGKGTDGQFIVSWIASGSGANAALSSAVTYSVHSK
jgi:hypothetical protein